MHSSRMCTACLLVDCIPWYPGVSANPLNADPPDAYPLEADPPWCRPRPLDAGPTWMQSPFPWMQISLDADPPWIQTPRGQKEWHTFVKTLPSCNYFCGWLCNGFEITFRKSTWVRTIYCLQIIWRENRKSQWKLWSAAILHGEDVVQAGCD